MLPRLYRIPKTAFPLPRTALRVDVGLGTLSFHPQSESPRLQCSTVISSKTYKRSVDRHRVKRRAAEVFSRYITITPLKGYLVFYPKSGQKNAVPELSVYKQALETGFHAIETRARR